MRYASYIILMFSIAFAFYLFGQTSAIAYVLGYNNQSPLSTNGEPVYGNQLIDSTNFAQRIGQVLSAPAMMQTLLGLGVATIIIAALTGFSSMYFIPLIILLLISPYLLMPIGMFMQDPACSQYSPNGVIGAADAYAIAHGTARSGNGWSYPNANYASAADQYSSCLAVSHNYMPYADALRLLLNILTVLAAISFVRGGV